MSPSTYTYTWTQTRVETIQDQFHHLLAHGRFDDDEIDPVIDAVGEKAIHAVGVYGCDFSRRRVAEVELRVDWALSSELTLKMPTITGGLSGWDGRQAPEIKVAGRRFATVAEKLGLTTNYWVALSPHVKNDPDKRGYWRARLHLAGPPPEWGDGMQERDETLLDLNEATVFIRRAGS
jgi:hypothetical protein